MSREWPIDRWNAGQFQRWRDSSDATSEVASFGADGPVTGAEVLAAVAHCARYGIAMPPVLARAFLDRYEVGAQHRVKSWDDPDAFDSPVPLANGRSQHLDRLAEDRLRQRYRFALVAFQRYQLANPKGLRGNDLLDAMAERFGIGSRNTLRPFVAAAADELEAMNGIERMFIEVEIERAIASEDWASLIQPDGT